MLGPVKCEFVCFFELFSGYQHIWWEWLIAVKLVKPQMSTPLLWSLKQGRGLPTPSGAFVWNSELVYGWNGIVRLFWNLWLCRDLFLVVTVRSDVLIPRCWWETEAAHFTLGTNPRTASSGKHRHGWWQPDTGSYGVWVFWFWKWMHSGFWGEWICDVLSKKDALRRTGCFHM